MVTMVYLLKAPLLENFWYARFYRVSLLNHVILLSFNRILCLAFNSFIFLITFILIPYTLDLFTLIIK